MSGYNGWESTHKHEHSSLYDSEETATLQCENIDEYGRTGWEAFL